MTGRTDEENGKTAKFCSKECSLTTVCILQLVATLERLVFDFLGYMWAPILTGFLNIIFILFGIFGAHQFRPKLLVVYAVWSALWLLWNLFVIFLYLEIAGLSLEKHSYFLNFGSGSESWWYENGLGCNVTYNITTADNGRVQQTRLGVEGCFLDYRYVEVIHAAVHIVLTLISLVVSILLIQYITLTHHTNHSPYNSSQYTHIEMSGSSSQL
ncbi:sodium/potassium-transporting ATPase subunit beta-1-interacting protein 3-like isoform X2 [Apostichopus japonicus]|uniref:sodium/potassium-transporting ATPase subunit beta-1-interacting protein 3-like isoform X2 n=1 Tax=Stichopus japonicus TaxID=307972 RepID=UPI003AB37622